ncbi:MAG TPA: RNA-binding protein [bacterium]|nr:RNA-binding protein [bacterium]
MNNKLYVGNLPYKMTEEALREAFAPAGEIVSVVIITDKFSGRSKGFGFVEYTADEAGEQAAAKAIEMWDGKELEGRPLRVNVARPPRYENNSQQA